MVYWLIVVYGILLLMLRHICPHIVETFSSMGGKLPLPTHMLELATGFVAKYFWLIAPAYVLLAFLLHRRHRLQIQKKIERSTREKTITLLALLIGVIFIGLSVLTAFLPVLTKVEDVGLSGK